MVDFFIKNLLNCLSNVKKGLVVIFKIIRRKLVRVLPRVIYCDAEFMDMIHSSSGVSVNRTLQI